MWRPWLVCAAAGTALALAAATHAESSAPDATLKLTGRSVAVGVGITWGSGTLTFQGKDYKVGVKGLAVGGVGVTTAEASGSVYSLKKLSDFDGNYTLLSSGVTAGAGTGLIAMSNPNGVTIELVSKTQGVQLSLASGGVELKLEK
ncbi:MAG TPA: hypothetical protein VGK30_17365 [Candidatus Binatia bacterium]|jgi:hypothetical protein